MGSLFFNPREYVLFHEFEISDALVQSDILSELLIDLLLLWSNGGDILNEAIDHLIVNDQTVNQSHVVRWGLQDLKFISIVLQD